MVWEEAVDDNGRVYYYDTATEVSQWERPEGFESRIDGLLAEHGWARYTTDEGEVYYSNEKTEESVWELPKEVVEAFKSESGGDNEKEEDVEDAVKETEETAPEPVESAEAEPEPEKMEISETVEAPTEVLESEANKLIGLDIPDEPVEKVSGDDPDKEFLGMLQEKGVAADWTAAKVMEVCVGDERYWNVDDALVRRKLHRQYLQEKEEEYVNQMQKSKEDHRITFEKVLKEHGVGYNARWAEVSEDIKQNDMPVKLQKQLFSEYVEQLRAEHAVQSQQERKVQIDRLTEELEPIVKYDTKFEELLKGLDLETKYSGLAKLDVLRVFEMVMAGKVKAFDETVAKESQLNLRADRRARDGFRDLLAKLERSGALKCSPDLRWHDFLAPIRDKREFIELCGHRGSSAIDFYWDILDRENQVISAKADLCRQTLVSSGVAMKDFADASQFAAKMREIGGPQISRELKPEDYSRVFELLKQERAPKRKHEEVVTSDRKRVRRMGYGEIR